MRCIADEVPFEIPDSWEWVRFNNLVDYSIGKTPPRKESEYWDNGKYSWVSISDMVPNGVIKSTKECISQYAYDNTFKKCPSIAGTLLMSFKLTVGKVSILDIDAFHNEAIISIFPYVNKNNIIRNYLFYHLPLLAQLGETKSAIKGNTLNSASLNLLLIPLPPIDEQQRIAKKIKKLLPYIEKYEQTESKLTALNVTFPEQLKRSILQQAVMGKLVPQDSNDEPASVLLEHIRAEKSRLIREGKIKKDKHESVIYKRNNSHYEKVDGIERCIDDEIPFEIPDSWEWTRLGNIVYKLTDGTHSTPKYVSDGIPFISVKDISSGKLNLKNCKYISKEEHKILYERCNPEKGDILLTKVGTTGIPVIVDIDNEFSLFVSVALLKFNIKMLNSEYLIELINSPLVQQQVIENTKGVGNKNWVIKDIANTLIVIPPLAEQQRIVNKINDLLPQIEKLQ